ncbi:hypothetical protein [Rhizobium leguminosarum]|uniref:hypothetical protein n=1 Tax=Rhizobium leguminosarum TaxID=384 RepID=UPI0002D683C9
MGTDAYHDQLDVIRDTAALHGMIVDDRAGISIDRARPGIATGPESDLPHAVPSVAHGRHGKKDG